MTDIFTISDEKKLKNKYVRIISKLPSSTKVINKGKVKGFLDWKTLIIENKNEGQIYCPRSFIQSIEILD